MIKIIMYIVIFSVVLGGAFYLGIINQLATLVVSINSSFGELMPQEGKIFVFLLIFVFVVVLGFSFT